MSMPGNLHFLWLASTGREGGMKNVNSGILDAENKLHDTESQRKRQRHRAPKQSPLCQAEEP